ncbi:MAG: hypothetical protein EXX96DRAFT_354697 [Benjaminiella poitrasii]|nr:MAG: hypothetical protein EXX96DRAFT_354697 [Benjaminiella poitrasii]
MNSNANNYKQASHDSQLEYAYQCDFQKRVPPNKPGSKVSLLSNLLSTVEQSNDIVSSTVDDSVGSQNDTIVDQTISKSLQQCSNWELLQNSLKIKNFRLDSSNSVKLASDEAWKNESGRCRFSFLFLFLNYVFCLIFSLKKKESLFIYLHV